MDKKCIIVGAGDFTPDFKKPSAGDIVIAADGGLLHLQSLNIRPDILIGDFDSLNKKVDSSLSDEIRLKRRVNLVHRRNRAEEFQDLELYACTNERV